MLEIADLYRFPIFASLDASELETLRKFVFERTYKSKATLFLEGMRGEVLYLIKQGKVDIVKKKGESEVLLATLGPGEFLGEMSIFDDEPRSATARITEDAVVVLVTKKSIQDLMQAAPGAANKMLIAILRIVNQRLRAANIRLTTESF